VTDKTSRNVPCGVVCHPHFLGDMWYLVVQEKRVERLDNWKIAKQNHLKFTKLNLLRWHIKLSSAASYLCVKLLQTQVLREHYQSTYSKLLELVSSHQGFIQLLTMFSIPFFSKPKGCFTKYKQLFLQWTIKEIWFNI